MASTREDVLSALFALLQSVGGAIVKRNHAVPVRIPANGLVIVRDGSPGEPEVSLSPLIYHYEHAATVEVLVQDGDRRDALFDSLCQAIGFRIVSDRTLGGRCDWIEAMAPEPTDIITEGGEPMNGAALTVVLHYATTNPI
jgi:hypothetical protein